MSKGEAYQNFATSIRAYQTLKTYRYQLVHYVSRVRDTLDLDKIFVADLDNRKQAKGLHQAIHRRAQDHRRK
jgi:hypothetical protein